MHIRGEECSKTPISSIIGFRTRPPSPFILESAPLISMNAMAPRCLLPFLRARLAAPLNTLCTLEAWHLIWRSSIWMIKTVNDVIYNIEREKEERKARRGKERQADICISECTHGFPVQAGVGNQYVRICTGVDQYRG